MHNYTYLYVCEIVAPSFACCAGITSRRRLQLCVSVCIRLACGFFTHGCLLCFSRWTCLLGKERWQNLLAAHYFSCRLILHMPTVLFFWDLATLHVHTSPTCHAYTPKRMLIECGFVLLQMRVALLKTGATKTVLSLTHHTTHTSHIIHYDTTHLKHHTSHITNHTSHITQHTFMHTYTCKHASHITHHTSRITYHTPHITPHTSHITQHASHITLHTSRKPSCTSGNPLILIFILR